MVIFIVNGSVPRDGYENTPYFQQIGPNFLKCLLCQTGGMHRKVVHRHLRGRAHQRNYAKLRASGQRLIKIEWCNAVQRRIDQLVLDRWEWHMNHLCQKYINSEEESSLVSPKQHILSKLKMYEKKEKLALLELKIWKIQCITSFAEITGADTSSVSMQDIEDYWTLDEHFNPVSYRKTCRSKSGIDMCIENVLPFLGTDF